MRRGLILCLAVLGFGTWITAPAPGGTTYGHQEIATRCVLNDTSYGDMIVAETTWQMWSNSVSPDGYRWRARFIPTHPGLNFFRSWNQVDVADVGTAGPSAYVATVSTPPMSAGADWDLEVKLTWDRDGARDYNVEHVLDFDERACVSG